MTREGQPGWRIREAGAADIPAMHEVRLAVRENVLSSPGRVTPAMYHDYLTVLGKGWLCETAQGELLGFSVADARDGSIWALFVRPGREGQGIGRALLELACDWLFACGHPAVSLSTGVGTRADRFYADCGWEREAQPQGREVSYTLPAWRHQKSWPSRAS